MTTNSYENSPKTKIYDVCIQAFTDLPELILHCETIDIEIDDRIISIPLSELRIMREQTIWSSEHSCFVHIVFE